MPLLRDSIFTSTTLFRPLSCPSRSLYRLVSRAHTGITSVLMRLSPGMSKFRVSPGDMASELVHLTDIRLCLRERARGGVGERWFIYLSGKKLIHLKWHVDLKKRWLTKQRKNLKFSGIKFQNKFTEKNNGIKFWKKIQEKNSGKKIRKKIL